jgi:nucleoside-triphosphatase THEP1
MSTMHVQIIVTGPRGCGKTRLLGQLQRALKDNGHFVTDAHMQETRMVGIPAEIVDIEIDTRPRDAMGLLRL